MKVLSNRALSTLKDSLSGQDIPDRKKSFKKGILVDGLITAPETVDFYKRTVLDSFGVTHEYDSAEMKVGVEMRDAFMNDILCKTIHAGSEFQVEHINPGVDFNGIGFATKAKPDGRMKVARWIWDLKTTSAATQGAFEDLFFSFDYDRSAFFYMETFEVDRMLFIAIGKTKINGQYPIFKLTVVRGDFRFESGREKTYDLVQMFYLTCQ